MSSVRRYIGVALVGLGAVGVTAVSVPVAHASNVITRPTSYVFTGPTALAACQAMGQQEVATNGWDGYSCKPDPTVDPTAERLWVIIYVG